MNNNKLQKWELLSKEPVFESKWLTIEKRSYKLPNGEIRSDYYHLERANYVLIIAVDDNNNLLLERQYRRGVDDFVYELPAGWINQGETAVDAAKRELQEETGSVGEGDSSYEIYAQPAFTSIKAYVVILKVIGKEETKMESDENIESEWVELNKVYEMIKSGEIKDMGFLSAYSIYKSVQKSRI